MADLPTQDRLQPSLLDRLIDDEPSKSVESVERRVLTFARLRESVLRDLNWLFNAARTLSDEEQEKYPYVASSVINYGLPAFSGQTASGLDLATMEKELRDAIIDFEPRLLADSVRIRARKLEHGDNQHNRLSFDIECKIWAQPAPLALLLHSDVDLESGQNSVRDSGRR